MSAGKKCWPANSRTDEHTPDKSQAEFLTDSYGVVHNQPVLVSLNTKYSPILISPEQRFEVVGKVLN